MKGKHFLLFIRYPPCYSNLPPSQVNVLAVIEEISIYLKVRDLMSLEILIFRNGQTDRDDDRIIFVAMTSTLGAT